MQEWKLEPAHDHGLNFWQRLRSHQRESGLVETVGHLAWAGLIRTYFRTFHRLSVSGIENLPAQPPFILVANHESHLDTLVLSCPLPWHLRDRVFPIAAGDVFFEKQLTSVFAVGFLNALPIWRKKCGPNALRILRERLVGEPCGYILFPEGGRSRDGNMMRFKAGLGMIVAGTDVPVVPCYLEGTLEAMPANRKVPRFRRISMRIGTPLTFQATPNERTGWEEIAGKTEAAVRELAGG